MSRLQPLLGTLRRGLRLPADWRERLKIHAPDALAWRLLLLTFLFTVVVEILIIVPSAASFHERWLLDRLQSAELASVGVEALPYSAVEDEAAEQLLAIGGAGGGRRRPGRSPSSCRPPTCPGRRT